MQGPAKLTLMVSSGWQTSASARPAPPPARRWTPIGVFFCWLDALADMVYVAQAVLESLAGEGEEAAGRKRDQAAERRKLGTRAELVGKKSGAAADDCRLANDPVEVASAGSMNARVRS